MLTRCYCPKLQARYPTYAECSVVDEWLLFSNFKVWMKSQDWHGKQLDKDILVVGNKEYSHETCVFISGAVNSLLTDCAALRGGCPQGVCWNKVAAKYQADCGVSGKKKHLGYFGTINKAEVAYLKFKSELIRDVASEQPRNIMDGLLRHAQVMENRINKLTSPSDIY